MNRTPEKWASLYHVGLTNRSIYDCINFAMSAIEDIAEQADHIKRLEEGRDNLNDLISWELAQNITLKAHMKEMKSVIPPLLALIDDMGQFVGQMSLQDYKSFNEAPIRARVALEKEVTL